MVLSDKSICESRDAMFFEYVFYMNKVSSSSVSELSKDKESIYEPSMETLHSSSTSPPPPSAMEPNRSKRSRVDTSFGLDFLTMFLVEGDDPVILCEDSVFLLLYEEVPKTFYEAMKSVDVIF